MQGWSVFDRRRTRTPFSQEKAKRFVMPYVLRLIAVSPTLGWFERAAEARRREAMGAMEINRCQKTPWSEEFDGKELHGTC